MLVCSAVFPFELKIAFSEDSALIIPGPANVYVAYRVNVAVEPCRGLPNVDEPRGF